jgi:hypothetical protein
MSTRREKVLMSSLPCLDVQPLGTTPIACSVIEKEPQPTGKKRGGKGLLWHERKIT